MRLEREPSNHRDPGRAIPTVSASIAVATDGQTVVVRAGHLAFTVEEPETKTVAEQLTELTDVALNLLAATERALLGEAVRS